MATILTGAAADVRELEYISALHQTDADSVRTDCSIRADDIRLFLMSRYGIKVSTVEVCKTILHGLGGSSDENEVLDLMEVVALLFIPTLLKAAREEQQKDKGGICGLPDPNMIRTPPGMLEYVLKMILHDATGDSKQSKRLDAKLLKRIFTAYGDDDIAQNDKLLNEMVRCATDREKMFGSAAPDLSDPKLIGKGSDESDSSDEEQTLDQSNQDDKGGVYMNNNNVLDLRAFIRGLTYDVQLYDIQNEVRLTTNYQDIFSDEDVYIDQKAKEKEKEKHILQRMVGEHCGQQLWFRQNKTKSGYGGGRTDRKLEQRLQNEKMLKERLSVAKKLEMTFTAPAIDITAGTMRSKTLMVFVWAAMLISYFAFSFKIIPETDGCEAKGIEYQYSVDQPWTTNTDAMCCEFEESMRVWWINFAKMCCQGIIVVSVGSLGNHLNTPLWKPIVGATFILGYVIVQFFLNRANNAMDTLYLGYMSSMLGLCAALYHVSHIVYILLPSSVFWLYPRIKTFFLSSGILAEINLKSACSFKLANMAQNALDIVKVNDNHDLATLDTHFAQGLSVFFRSSKQRHKTLGGFFSTWKRLWTRSAFQKDGIWISTRLLAGNMAQFIVTIYILLSGIQFVNFVSESYDSHRGVNMWSNWSDQLFDKAMINESIVSDFTLFFGGVLGDYLSTVPLASEACSGNATAGLSAKEIFFCGLASNQNLDPKLQLSLLQNAGFDVDYVVNQTRLVINKAVQESAETMYPSQKYMVMYPVIIGTACAVLSSFYMSVMYLPSVTLTTLQLRSGAIPTMRDWDFQRYRTAPDQVAILTGSLFWGCFIGSLVVGGSIGIIIFVCLWQCTAYFIQRFVAIAIGVICITLVRWILVNFLRCSLYTAFYRRSPAAANILLLGLEWATFALSIGFVLVRMIKLLLVTAGFIGRIDTPFLAPGVGRIGKVELDFYPTVHTKDILSIEAHRHPYIELLGVMYMMKLRYADHFGKTAGSCWRLLFVYALFPWLSHYRVKKNPDDSIAGGFGGDDLRFTPLRYISKRARFSSSSGELSLVEEEEDELKRAKFPSSSAELSPVDEEDKLEKSRKDLTTPELDVGPTIPDDESKKDQERAMDKEMIQKLKAEVAVLREALQSVQHQFHGVEPVGQGSQIV